MITGANTPSGEDHHSGCADADADADAAQAHDAASRHLLVRPPENRSPGAAPLAVEDLSVYSLAEQQRNKDLLKHIRGPRGISFHFKPAVAHYAVDNTCS